MGNMKETLFRIRNSIRNTYLEIFRVQKIGKRCAIDKDIEFVNGKAKRHKGIIIEDDCLIRAGCRLVTATNLKESGILMKKGSGLNRGCILLADGGIVIGQNSNLGPMVCMVTGTHEFSNPDVHITNQKNIFKKIVIEDDCWIGAAATILCGVTIGKGSVIGAGALVNKDIPPYSVAVGVPAKVIKKRGEK
jgi:galactoside O-acetyltransferase